MVVAATQGSIMKLLDLIPIGLIALAGVVALTFEDAPAYPGQERSAIAAKPAALPDARWIPAVESVLPDPTPAAEIEPAAKQPAPEAGPAIGIPPAAAKPKPAPRARIQVEARRPGADQRIEAAAVKVLERMPNLSGCIGVEARHSVVRLTGWTTTAAQSLRAQKAVGRVAGVKGVINQIRPRVGAITS